MWKTLGRNFTPIIRKALALPPESVLQQQLRTTFILKRRHAPYLHRHGSHSKRLRNKHFIYDLEKDTVHDKTPDLEVILTTYVAGIGNVGDKVKVRPDRGYNHFLLPGLAVYASPENIERYKDYGTKEDQVVYSSPTAQRTISCLSRLTLSVVMNQENPWTLEAWHIKACFRKCGYHVPVETIKMPSTPITGPNMDLEGKEFYVTVTVNNTEKTNVRCLLHHWTTDVVERLPYKQDFWKERNELIFQEDEQVLTSLPSYPTAEVDKPIST